MSPTTYCPACGEVTTADDRFCTECGQSLEADQPAAEGGGARRAVDEESLVQREANEVRTVTAGSARHAPGTGVLLAAAAIAAIFGSFAADAYDHFFTRMGGNLELNTGRYLAIATIFISWLWVVIIARKLDNIKIVILLSLTNIIVIIVLEIVLYSYYNPEAVYFENDVMEFYIAYFMKDGIASAVVFIAIYWIGCTLNANKQPD